MIVRIILRVNSKDNFSGSFGVVLAAVGSAIGLGNIWKFPYMTGVNGGSAFVVIYLICIAFIGVPLVLSAFIIGRNAGENPISAYKKIAPNTLWFLNGWLGTLVGFIILTFYSVVAGWAIYYAYLSAAGSLAGLSPNEVGAAFGSFSASVWKPVCCQVIFMIATGYILLKGVKDGIEKFSRLLMPLLLVLLIILDIRAVTLEGSAAGLEFLFNPDFSKLTLSAVLSALGHAFFTLSVGAGTMITYGSYIKKENHLMPIVANIAFADTLIAIMAGVAIFPAVFAFGVEPASGPGLVFVTLPNIFNMMPMGQLFSFIFFVLLSVAALTSSISMIEPSIAYLISEFKWGRKKATIVVSIAVTLTGSVLSQGNGVLNSLKLPFYFEGQVHKMDIFGWVITLTDQLMPICGFFIAIFVGWYMDKKLVQMEASSNGKFNIWYFSLFRFAIKYTAPAAIILIFVTAIFGVFK